MDLRLARLEPAAHHRLLALLRPSPRRIVVASVLILAAWGWFDVRARAVINPNDHGSHKTDLTVYTEAGAAFFDGRDPYRVANPRGWTYLYPPLFAIAMAPLSLVSPPTQAIVWFTLCVLACWGSVRECVRIARSVFPDEPDRGWFGPIDTRWGLTAVATAAFPALNCLQRGQVSVAKVYLLLLGLRLLVESRGPARSFLAGLVLALPVSVKLTPVVPVAAVLAWQFLSALLDRHGQRTLARPALALGGCVAGLLMYFFLLPAAAIGSSANLHHLHTWFSTIALNSESTANEDFAGDSTSKRNQSFSNGVRRLGNWTSYQFAGGVYDDDPRKLPPDSPRPIMESKWVDGVLIAGRVAAAIGLGVVIVRLAASGEAAGGVIAFSLACIATLVVAPIARGHYFVLTLPAAMFVPQWLSTLGQPRRAAQLSVVMAVLTVGHYALIDVFGRIGLLGIGTALWYAATCWTVARLATSNDEPVTLRLPSAFDAEPVAIRRAA